MRSIGHGLSDVGREREINEDSFLVDDRHGVYAVSDGLGGHSAGEEAARLAIGAVHEAVRVGRGAIGDTEDLEPLRRLASDAMKAACAQVYAEAVAKPELAGMGCTLTLLLTSGSKAAMAHVGDTRLYLCREGSTWQLSSDHTLVADLVRRGEITAEDAAEHPYSSALTRALGSQASVTPEILVLDLLADDVLLVCSDGLSRYMEGPGELSSFLAGDEPLAAPRGLIERANSKGGSDNITAVVVRVVAEDRELEAALSGDVRSGLRALRKVPALGAGRFADLLRIFDCADIRTYARGATVIAQQERLHALHVPLAGELEVERSDGTQDRVQCGQTLGLTSLLVPRQWTARVTARSEVKLLRVDGGEFRRLARRRPWLGIRVFEALAQELAAELPEAACAEGHARPLGAWWSPARWLRALGS